MRTKKAAPRAAKELVRVVFGECTLPSLIVSGLIFKGDSRTCLQIASLQIREGILVKISSEHNDHISASWQSGLINSENLPKYPLTSLPLDRVPHSTTCNHAKAGELHSILGGDQTLKNKRPAEDTDTLIADL